VRVVPSVAIFGIGHVGLELARILSRHEIELDLIDSRAEMIAPERLGVVGERGGQGALADAVANVRVHHLPVPEAGLAVLPPGAHVLIMTHDHVEDLAIVDTALRTEGVGSIGLIGSRSKWARFQKELREAGHDDAALARVTTPIGIPGIRSKDPAAIAVSVAARVLQLVEEAAVVR
jgi:xanthine dehydrogenase accessory protein XdhC